jgi:hypothetical protein
VQQRFNSELIQLRVTPARLLVPIGRICTLSAR